MFYKKIDIIKNMCLFGKNTEKSSLDMVDEVTTSHEEAVSVSHEEKPKYNEKLYNWYLFLGGDDKLESFDSPEKYFKKVKEDGSTIIVCVRAYYYRLGVRPFDSEDFKVELKYIYNGDIITTISDYSTRYCPNLSLDEDMEEVTEKEWDDYCSAEIKKGAEEFTNLPVDCYYWRTEKAGNYEGIRVAKILYKGMYKGNRLISYKEKNPMLPDNKWSEAKEMHYRLFSATFSSEAPEYVSPNFKLEENESN